MEHLHETLIDFAHIANKQEEKGVVKYGQPLDPYDKYDWLDMAKEELVDAYKYLHAEQVRRNYVIAQIRESIKYNVPLEKHDEISDLLDKLEGG